MIHEPGFRYNHAPIAEAVLAINVDGVAPFDLERLAHVDLPDYPRHDELHQFENDTEFNPAGVTTRTSQRVSGRRIATEDGLQVAMMTESSLVFGRLAPYDTWPTFADEGMRLWDAYASIVRPETVMRLGLRYINQIKLPPGAVDLEDYLRTRPEISPDMPQNTSGFFLSMDVPLPDHDAVCRVTETIVGLDEGSALVLDIDVGREGRYDPRDHGELRSILDTLRDAKNLVFEASITDTARELFS